MNFLKWIKAALAKRKVSRTEHEAGRAWAEAAMDDGMSEDDVYLLANEHTPYGRGMLDAIPQAFP